ncbi:hypothetical protein FS837_012804 [Tulasnella sp. UAMH 9824]|nr:hypothetical protein FS837_012804 [Tulasnella sp. UAMH 9824]
MANFAYVCFTKKALRWYEELDEQTRNDWRLLRGAILAKYTTPPQSPSIIPSSAPASTSLPGSAHHISAAAPPTTSTVRRGRIRIDRQRNGGASYVSGKSSGVDETSCNSADNVADASVFEIDTISRTITSQAGGSRLAVRAYGEGWTLDPSKPKKPGGEYGALVRSFPGSKPSWPGTKLDDIWSVGPDGKIVASVKRSDGSLFNLEVAVYRNGAGAIYLQSDINEFIKYQGSRYQAAVSDSSLTLSRV